MKDNVEAPPDATVFRANGQTYFLYMGALEMRALQREWGLERSQVDSPEAWQKKTEEFQGRIDGFALEDKITAIRHGLTRWAKAAANGEGPIVLTDERVIGILETLEQTPEPGHRKRAPWLMIQDLHRRFMFDAFGINMEDATPETEADPKEQPQEGSTPSDS